MTPLELRASLSLASLYAFRMLGLFLILPVFAVHAHTLPGGDDPLLVGLVLGIYSLTQGLLQLPFGMASDRLGRKPVIVFGLVLFALGSLVAAHATDIAWTIVGRALQGTGAISAAVTACIADLTRDSQRTKAMALVGASIGLTFALSLVAAPLLYEWVGMAGLFHLTGAMAVLGIAIVLFAVPPLHVPAHAVAADGTRLERTRFREVALDGELLRLNVGIFALHMVQMAMFVVLPAWLVERAQLPLADHWKIYLPVVAASFVLMVPPITWGERAGRLRAVVLASIALILAAQLGYAAQPVGVWTFAVLLLVFFAAFNVLEATVPSMVSRLAPPDVKGTALGLYNTVQALGLFAGGAIGGWASSRFGGVAVFVLCAGVMAVWFVVAMGARRWPQPGGRRAAAGAG
ncbi:MAG: MFS transporter [Burkholderiales bacterium]|jgi:MFS family permease